VSFLALKFGRFGSVNGTKIKLSRVLLNSSKNITIAKHKTATIINLGQKLYF